MTKQTINIGSSGNDGTGDKLRIAFNKVNQNFDELYSNTSNLAVGKLSNTSGVSFAGNLYFPVDSKVGIGTNNPVIPLSIVSNNASQVGLEGGLFDATGNSDFTIQINIRNESSGTNASSDIVATNDTGVDYVDLGINSSTYNNQTWTITEPGDAYLYVSNNSIAIGTLSDHFIKFFTNGQLSNNEIMRVGNNKVGILTNDPQFELDVFGAINASLGVYSPFVFFSNSLFSIVDVPTSSIGDETNVLGQFAANSTYLYYCTGDYDGVTNIWKRISWSGDTW